MTIVELFLSQFEPEMKTTRRLLERVPSERFGWKPHARSSSFGELAAHVALIPGYGASILQSENLPGGPIAESPEQVLHVFDEQVNRCKRAAAGMQDSDMLQPWSLEAGGRRLITLPKAAALHTVMLRHLIHHRGQLSVYLRLNDVPVPSIYGPTADEPMR